MNHANDTVLQFFHLSLCYMTNGTRSWAILEKRIHPLLHLDFNIKIHIHIDVKNKKKGPTSGTNYSCYFWIQILFIAYPDKNLIRSEISCCSI